MAHIAAGTLKGFRLAAPRHIRLTEGKVRQALFNILGSRVIGARVVDAFAGSGALGLEALSRGAREAVFLESDPRCCRALRQNLLRIGAGRVDGEGRLVPGDVLRTLPRLRGGPVDLLLMDPPYQGALGTKALRVASACGILAASGSLCLEHARHADVPREVGELTLSTQHRYGQTVLSFYQRRSP